jgi:predicted transcriptional regulator
MITEMRHADNGGHLEHKTKFFTKDLMDALDISKTTARRIMKELQLLGVVRVGKESRYADGKHKEDYIELLDRFKWLIEESFQKIAMILNSRISEKRRLVKEKDRIDRHKDSRMMKRLLSGAQVFIILLSCFYFGYCLLCSISQCFVLFYKGV